MTFQHFIIFSSIQQSLKAAIKFHKHKNTIMTFPEILEKHFPNQFLKKDIGKLQELVEFCLNLKLKELKFLI